MSARRPPGPSQLEVLKDLPLILGDRLRWLEKLHSRYGDVVRVPMGPRANYIVFHPDHIHRVLVANAKAYSKGRAFEKTASYMGSGLATSEGKLWQVQRRRMNPHFHRDALKQLTHLITENIDLMLARWEEKAKTGDTVDLAQEFPRFAMETVAKALFGNSVPVEKIDRILEAMRTALVHTTRRILNPLNIPDSLPLPSNLRFNEAVKTLDEIVYEFIDEEAKKDEPSPTLLGMLLRAEDPETGELMSRKQMRDEVMTMFLGGTDTSGNTMSWLFYVLDRYPQVQAKVRSELESIDPATTAEERLEKLDYTRRVIEETLRLYPQNWLGSRDSLQADEIGGYAIPAGVTVFLGVYRVHRRPDFWDKPETFDPERFLAENAKGKHAFRYLPFGGGTRKCIGFNFALMEITLVAAKALERFEFEILNRNEIKPYATWSLWPQPGVIARMKPRSS